MVMSFRAFPFRPRALRSERNAAQAAADSESARTKPRISRRPSPWIP
jgi:hypothetical protein